MLLIGRGCPREHPKGTSDLVISRGSTFGVTWPSVITGDVSWCHFRSKSPIRTDIAQLPVAHACAQGKHLRGHVTSITSGSHGTCSTVLHFVLLLLVVVQNVPVAHAQNILPIMTSPQFTSFPVTWLTSLSVNATSGDVTSGSSPLLPCKC